jgi:tRNA modification GTPase
MLGEDRAIVSPEPGTTRDVVEARIEVEGIELILQDTAGLREAEGRIESEGILRTGRAIERADVVLLIVDQSEPRWPDDETLELLKSRLVVLVWNKIDLRPSAVVILKPSSAEESHVLSEWTENKRSFTSFRMTTYEAEVSALTGAGIEALLHKIMAIVLGEDIGNEEIVIAEARHHDAMTRAIESLSRAQLQLSAPTLLASDLRDAVNALGEITGETVGEEILDRIFSKFCIGK